MRASTRRPTVLRPPLRTPVRATAVLATAATLALLAGTTTTAHASPGTPTPVTSGYTRTFSDTTASSADLRMRQALTSRATTTRFGTAFSGAVIDAQSNRVVWTKNGSTALMPASTTKLVTASNALTVFGPTKRFTTRVRNGSAGDRVVVEGSGDPSLSSAQLDAMAKTVAGVLKARGLTVAPVKVYV